MSEFPADLDHREQFARIDRSIAETEKLQAETRRFAAEQNKLAAEQTRFAAAARKLIWDARLAPYLAIAAVIGGLLGLASLIAQFMGH